MAVWEYKVISSGKGGFATPALMESFLNQLGKEEWEIIHFHTPPDNPLAFQGLARRTTQRDWTLEDAAAAAARTEAEKLRAEFEAKFRGSGASGGSGGAGGEEKPETLAEQKANTDDGLRKLRDTEHDLDREADGDEEETAASGAEPDEWDKLGKEEELPTFFEAIQPLMRRNPRGAGMSVGVDHLAKKWGLSEDDIMGALKECGFAIPEDEDDKPEYVEYDGDLFWVNVNRRGEIWVNTKEKPRPVFKPVKAERFASESESKAQAAYVSDTGPASAPAEVPAESPAESPAAAPAAAEGSPSGRERDDRRRPRGLPEGDALLERIRPMMRRDRGGQGASGSVGFLSRALKCRENELTQAFQALGLTLPGAAGEPAGEVTFAGHIWSLHKDQRGGIWITDRRQRTPRDEKAGPVPPGEDTAGSGGQAGPDDLTGHGSALSPATSGDPALSSEAPSIPARELAAAERDSRMADESAEPPSEASPVTADESQPSSAASAGAAELIATLRPLLKETRSGGLAGEIGALAESIGRTPPHLLSDLEEIGLKVPDKAREKAVTIEVDGAAVSLTRNAKDEIWVNVKAPGAAKPPRRVRRGPASEASADDQS